MLPLIFAAATESSKITAHTLCLAIAFVLFIAGGCPYPHRDRVSLFSFGGAFLTLSFLVT